MKITVLQSDIDAGVTLCSACPLALAMSRTLSKPIIVGLIMWSDKSLAEATEDDWHPLPETARLFRSAFDAGFPVQPFEFEINLNS